MNIIDCTQGDHEWFSARLGKVTASEVADAVRFLKRGDKKGEEGKTRLSYKAAIVSEILTGDPADTFVSKYMERGTELEPYARTAYEIKRAAGDVEPCMHRPPVVGFCELLPPADARTPPPVHCARSP